jgi:hypothetical protein
LGEVWSEQRLSLLLLLLGGQLRLGMLVILETDHVLTIHLRSLQSLELIHLEGV